MLEYSESAIGVTFGTWTIIGISHRPSDIAQKEFLCRCKCGAEKLMRRHRIARGERMKCRQCAGKLLTPRQLTDRGRLWKVWDMMHRRCEIETTKTYQLYGGRGISVCYAWSQFEPFWIWATASGYEHGKQIDRIDNDGPYSPDNCRFVTRQANCNNTRRNRFLEAFGEKKTFAQWRRDPRCVVGRACLEQRITKLHWAPEIAITKPQRHIGE